MYPKINALHAAALAAVCSSLPIQAHADLIEDKGARLEILKHRADLKEIKDKLDSEIKNINTRIDNGIEQLARRIDTKAEDKKVNNFYKDLEQLRSELTDEVAKLRGQIETLNSDLNKAQQETKKLTNDLANQERRATDFYTDLTKRLSKLEPVSKTIDGVEYEITKTEQKAYDEAFALIQKKNFTAAAQALTRFLQRFPDSGYSAEANYLLGTSHLTAGDCKSAIPVLQTVVKRYELSQRASDAMLNLAVCHDDLDDQDAARNTLEALIKKYPKSDAAKTARERLKSLQ